MIMNIFYLDKRPDDAAEMHCDKHCVKMILEYAQMLSTAHRVLDEDDAHPDLYKIAHKNHPSTIWTRSSKQHYDWLFRLFRMLSAEYSIRFGLINDMFDPEELHERVMAVAKTISSKSSYILKLGKETFYKQLDMSLEEAYEYASERMIKNLQAEDAKEGIDAFLNKRDPKWKNS